METKHPIKVVIIEDDETIRQGFSYLINNSVNYAVVNSYANAEQAIAKIVNDEPQVILLDIELPGMKGTDAIKKLKQLYSTI